MKKILFSLLAALTLTACHNNTESTTLFNNFATLEAVSANGALLSVQHPGDSKIVSLTATQQINPASFTVGSRVFITYTTETNTNTTSGACSLQAMYNTEGGGAQVKEATPETTNYWESDEIQLSEVTVTGQYLNIVGAAQFSTDKYSCELYVDATTINDAYPSVHLVLVNEGYLEQYYTLLGSWSIENLLASGNCKGINFYCNNPNYASPVKIEF